MGKINTKITQKSFSRAEISRWAESGNIEFSKLSPHELGLGLSWAKKIRTFVILPLKDCLKNLCSSFPTLPLPSVIDDLLLHILQRWADMCKVISTFELKILYEVNHLNCGNIEKREI